MNRRYNRLFVSNVSSSANLDELKEMFEKVGKLVNYDINGNQGYIEYEDSKTAQEAVRKYDDYKFEGKRLFVENSVKSNNRYQKTYRSDQRDKFKRYKDEGRCFKCHERGHRAFDCKENSREKKKSDRKRYNRSRSRDQSSSRSRSIQKRRSRSD